MIRFNSQNWSEIYFSDKWFPHKKILVIRLLYRDLVPFSGISALFRCIIVRGYKVLVLKYFFVFSFRFLLYSRTSSGFCLSDFYFILELQAEDFRNFRSPPKSSLLRTSREKSQRWWSFKVTFFLWSYIVFSHDINYNKLLSSLPNFAKLV